MVIVDKAAVRAHGDVHAGLFIVFISCGCNLNECACLTSADALGLTGNADRAAADADLDKICAGLGKEQEAVTVNDIACADLDAVSVALSYKVDSLFLPAGVALGGVDAQNICASLDECGDTGLVITAVDACADYVALLAVEYLVGVCLMLGVVLAETKYMSLPSSLMMGRELSL